MGIGLSMLSIFAMIPSPILFGYIIGEYTQKLSTDTPTQSFSSKKVSIFFIYDSDQSCIVWGKTCTGKGNCWLYNSRTLRYSLNLTSAGKLSNSMRISNVTYIVLPSHLYLIIRTALMSIGALFDVGVWYLAKNIQIFDEEIEVKKKKRKPETNSLSTVSLSIDHPERGDNTSTVK